MALAGLRAVVDYFIHEYVGGADCIANKASGTPYWQAISTLGIQTRSIPGGGSDRHADDGAVRVGDCGGGGLTSCCRVDAEWWSTGYKGLSI